MLGRRDKTLEKNSSGLKIESTQMQFERRFFYCLRLEKIYVIDYMIMTFVHCFNEKVDAHFFDKMEREEKLFSCRLIIKLIFVLYL